MTKEAYETAIKEPNKFVILLDNSNGDSNEILRVFDTLEDAHEYASGRIPHTKTNRIEIYQTTGLECDYVDGIRYRNDIKPYQQHHIGINW